MQLAGNSEPVSFRMQAIAMSAKEQAVSSLLLRHRHLHGTDHRRPSAVFHALRSTSSAGRLVGSAFGSLLGRTGSMKHRSTSDGTIIGSPTSADTDVEAGQNFASELAQRQMSMEDGRNVKASGGSAKSRPRSGKGEKMEMMSKARVGTVS